MCVWYGATSTPHSNTFSRFLRNRVTNIQTHTLSQLDIILVVGTAEIGLTSLLLIMQDGGQTQTYLYIVLCSL